VVGAKYPHVVGEVFLQQWDRLGGVSRCLVSAAEIVAGAQGVGVVGAEHQLGVGEPLLESLDRLVGPPRRVGGTVTGRRLGTHHATSGSVVPFYGL
jgi:hypothetical protein